jgi:hypothetical protein
MRGLSSSCTIQVLIFSYVENNSNSATILPKGGLINIHADELQTPTTIITD